MNFPEYWHSVWIDPAFQALSTSTRMLFFGAACQVDIVGWWKPHPVLIKLEIPDLQLDDAIAELAPWVQRHPSGYLSLRGYVAVQAPAGLKPSNGFHLGLQKRLLMHRVREVRMGADPSSVEGLGLAALGTGGVDPTSEPLGSPSGGAPEPLGSPSGGALSTKSQVQGPNVTSPESTGESEGSAVPHLEPSEVADHLVSLLVTIELMGGPRPATVQAEEWELGAFREALERHGWGVVSKAALAYCQSIKKPATPSLRSFLRVWDRWVKASCVHPKDKRRWWCVDLDSWPDGMKERRWACEVCEHCEPETGQRFIKDHEHVYEAVAGKMLVLGEDGHMEEVRDGEQCGRCGHSRRAAQPHEVAA